MTFSTNVPTKICKQCHKTKSLTDFYVCAKYRDGRRYVCKACEAHYKHIRQQTSEYKSWRHQYQSAHPETWGYGWLSTEIPDDILQEYRERIGIPF